MAPTKSVTAVIGIDRSGKRSLETEESRCGKKDEMCRLRQYNLSLSSGGTMNFVEELHS